MINNITVPEYKEILPMICLDDSHHLNGNVVDDASLEVMLRIEKEMQRLKVMGSDERRTLWLEIHLPGRGSIWNGRKTISARGWTPCWEEEGMVRLNGRRLRNGARITDTAANPP